MYRCGCALIPPVSANPRPGSLGLRQQTPSSPATRMRLGTRDSKLKVHRSQPTTGLSRPLAPASWSYWSYPDLCPSFWLSLQHFLVPVIPKVTKGSTHDALVFMRCTNEAGAGGSRVPDTAPFHHVLGKWGDEAVTSPVTDITTAAETAMATVARIDSFPDGGARRLRGG